MICRHELIKKELLEHKANFDTVWASNQKIQNLAGLMYSSEKVIAEALLKAIEEVPYLAFASKKQLSETFKNALNLNNVKNIDSSDIQKFSSLVFEMKKPLKTELISHLNERYGVNVQNLKEPATFKSLLNTQVVIFETLSKISPKKSLLRDTLSTLAESLKGKSGVEAIDCNEVIQEVFIAAGYDDTVINESLASYLNFDEIAQQLIKVSDILKLIKGSDAGAGAMGQASPMTPPMPSPAAQAPVPSAAPQAGMEDDDVTAPLTPDDAEETPETQGGMEAGGDVEGVEPPEEEPADMDLPDDQYMKVMKDLEEVLAALKTEVGIEDEEGMEGEEPEEGMEDEGDEIDAEQEELDAEEDAIEAKHEKAHEIENEAEAEEEGVRKKQKKAEKKEDKLKRMK